MLIQRVIEYSAEWRGKPKFHRTQPYGEQEFFFYQNDSEWPEMDFKHNSQL